MIIMATNYFGMATHQLPSRATIVGYSTASHDNHLCINQNLIGASEFRSMPQKALDACIATRPSSVGCRNETSPLAVLIWLYIML